MAILVSIFDGSNETDLAAPWRIMALLPYLGGHQSAIRGILRALEFDDNSLSRA